MLWYILVISACILSFGFGCYLYVNASSKCTKGALFAVDRCTHNHAETEQEILLKRLMEYVEFYSRVRQLSIMMKY